MVAVMWVKINVRGGRFRGVWKLSFELDPSVKVWDWAIISGMWPECTCVPKPFHRPVYEKLDNGKGFLLFFFFCIYCMISLAQSCVFSLWDEKFEWNGRGCWDHDAWLPGFINAFNTDSAERWTCTTLTHKIIYTHAWWGGGGRLYQEFFRVRFVCYSVLCAYLQIKDRGMRFCTQ